MDFKIDDIDQDLLIYRWYSTTKGYAQSSTPPYRHKRMHRIILSRVLGRELNINEHVDHINRDRADNRRENLRVATNRQNCLNRETNKIHPCISIRENDKYQVRIQTGNGYKSFGVFCTLDEAIQIRDKVWQDLGHLK